VQSHHADGGACMSVQRVALTFESNFARIPNAWVRDIRLSRRARGFLAELMSHEIGWTITFDSLLRGGTEGRDAIKAAMRELEQLGYLRRIQNKDADGKFGNLKYIITEPEVLITGDWKTVDGLAASGKPATKKTRTSLEDQDIEDQEPKQAPDKPVAADPKPEDEIAKYAYDQTSGALKYIAIRGIAKWALETKGTSPDQVKVSIDVLYQLGKPVTKTTLGQYLDGYIRGGQAKPSTKDRMVSTLELARRMEQNQLSLGENK